MHPLIVVAGPTASGKSDLAIDLARRFNGEIISADSRQVYRGMDIGTGKVTVAEQHQVHHWLIDVASPKRQYTVAQFQRAAQKAIRDIIRRGKVPILCGGTGFWIDAVVYDQELPNVKPDTALRAKLEKESTPDLYARLQELDPDRALSIDRHNRRRLIRALEIVTTTGKTVPKLKKRTSPYHLLYLATSVPMDTLKQRIEERLDTRLAAGMVDEVEDLHRDGVSWSRLEAFGLEYRWIAKLLQKKISHQDMRDGLLHDIIAYAKRQMTWLKRNPDIIWVVSAEKAELAVRQFLLE